MRDAMTDVITRRRFMGAAAGLGGALLLGACGGSEETSTAGGSAAGAGSNRPVNFVGYGGTTQDAQLKAWGGQYTKATGGRVNAVSPTDYGKLKSMVDSGNVTWDAVVVEGYFAHTPGNAELFTPLDKEAIDAAALQAVGGDGPEGDQVTESSAACYQYAFCTAYRTDKKGDHPTTWEQFFDTKAFPGTRGLYGYPYGTLEIALAADGVAWEDMYPLDVDRGLKKLRSLKGNVQYWTGGAQSQQLLIGGSADYVVVWDTRAVVLAGMGHPVAVEWGQNIRTADHLVVPKGSKSTKEAMQFVSAAISAGPQAAYSSAVGSSPANPQALGRVEAKVRPNLASSHTDESYGYISNDYWGKSYNDVLEGFNAVVKG